MNEFNADGIIGNIFTYLAFSTAFIGFLAFVFAEKLQNNKVNWRKIGKITFLVHFLSIFGIVGTLFHIIFTHQYQYQYAWSHSSNELPFEYILSCFWEGQEGSFLLWAFWHAMLGSILLFTEKGEFKNWLMAIISSSQVILVSMILGLELSEIIVKSGFIALNLGIVAILAKRYLKFKAFTPLDKAMLFSIILGIVYTLALVFSGKNGFLDAEGEEINFFLNKIYQLPVILLFVLLVGKLLVYRKNPVNSGLLVLTSLAMSIAYIGAHYEFADWTVGSSPFKLLRDAFPDNPVFIKNPEYTPLNGSGLNSLLQNYWMVIHPPTLFLGFALMLIPYAYMMAGLMKRNYEDWIKKALPWMSLGGMILGIGIIMGGYWAYETLNFEGYWNWDPVENSSLVPWLFGIATLHTYVAYRQKKHLLNWAISLTAVSFIFVLYSTFLTRSGILGEASVHTFTDLGLSGQLLIFLFAYIFGTTILYATRYHEIPKPKKEIPTFSKTFLLYLGILVIVITSAEITLVTSIPVINKIFSLNLAPPVEVQFFYYKWNVWFAILISLLAGGTQYFWWRKVNKTEVFKAIFRPFIFAIATSLVIIALLAIFQWEFVYDKVFNENLDLATSAGTTGEKIQTYLSYPFLIISEELLLFSSIFAFFASMDVFILLLRKNKKNLKMTGGALAHIGFALMLIGILFSSGFDSVVSINFNADDFKGFTQFPDEDKIDNVKLLKGESQLIKDYIVEYNGTKEATAPISELEIMEQSLNVVKFSFKDSLKDKYMLTLPIDIFLPQNKKQKPEKKVFIDPTFAKKIIEANIKLLRPQPIDKRLVFKLNFYNAKDTSKKFTLLPEAEVSMQGESASLLAHPSRKIFWDKDIYVHITGMPSGMDKAPKINFYEKKVAMGDTFNLMFARVVFEGMNNLTNIPKMKDYDIAIQPRLHVFTGMKGVGQDYYAFPTYLVKGNKPQAIDDYIEEIGLRFNFIGVDYDSKNPNDPGKIILNIEEQELKEDYVIIKAVAKPYINFLWLGTIILSIGFGISLYRRFRE